MHPLARIEHALMSLGVDITWVLMMVVADWIAVVISALGTVDHHLP